MIVFEGIYNISGSFGVLNNRQGQNRTVKGQSVEEPLILQRAYKIIDDEEGSVCVDVGSSKTKQLAQFWRIVQV